MKLKAGSCYLHQKMNLLNDVYDVLLNYENSEIIKNQPQSESKVSLSKVEVNTILSFDTNVRHKLEMFH